MATEKEYKELKEAVVMGVTVANSLYLTYEDGEATLSDARFFIDDIGAIRDGIEDISFAYDAIKSTLSEEQEQDLFKTVREVGEFGGGAKEEDIEDLTVIGLKIALLSFEGTQLVKKIRA